MQPVSPVLEGFEAKEEVFAKNQPQYIPLPVLRSGDRTAVTSRWRLTDEERLAVAAGADIFLTQMNFGESLQPVNLKVPLCPQDMGLIVSL